MNSYKNFDGADHRIFFFKNAELNESKSMIRKVMTTYFGHKSSIFVKIIIINKYITIIIQKNYKYKAGG